MKDATLKQGMKLWQLVDEKGTPCEQLQKLLGSGLVSDLLDANVDQVDRDAFRQLLGLKPLIVPCNISVYPISVNYDRSVKDGIAAGKYDWKNNGITLEHFPSQETGTREATVELFHYGKNMSTDEVLADLDNQGYRPATLKELLSLGEKHPDLQREFPIIGLGSVWLRPIGRDCPCLDRVGSLRSLSLYGLGFGWLDYCRFAAVRK